VATRRQQRPVPPQRRKRRDGDQVSPLRLRADTTRIQNRRKHRLDLHPRMRPQAGRKRPLQVRRSMSSVSKLKESPMSIAKALLEEFEIQAPITRRFVERLPEDKYTWKPHAKSMTAGQLAYHLASVPGGVVRLANANPTPEPSFNFPQPANRQ